MTHWLHFDEAWWARAAVEGRRRKAHHVSHSYYRSPAGGDDNAEEYDVNGVAGEWAFRNFSGLPWTGWRPVQGGYGRQDQEFAGYEVRSTDHQGGHLIIKRGDPVGQRYVLVIIAPPECGIVGWIEGKDGKRERFWNPPWMKQAAYGVPQADLTPFYSSKEER